MTKADTAKALRAVLRANKPGATLELTERDPIEELIFSFLIWEGAPDRKAELALARLVALGADLNELRTFEVSDLAATIGKTYPLVEDRALRIKTALRELYLRENVVTLDGALALSKRDGRRYLESIIGMPPFVAARVTLVTLGGHALPLDRSTMRILEDGEVIEPDQPIDKVSGSLERQVKAADALQTHLILQHASASAETPRKRSTTRRTSKASSTKSVSSGKRRS